MQGSQELLLAPGGSWGLREGSWAGLLVGSWAVLDILAGLVDILWLLG